MLKLLGVPSQSGSGLFPKRGYEVVALATLRPERRITRSEVATLLWPDADEERARGNLRYVLAAIRKWEQRNGLSLLLCQGDDIEVCAETDLDIALKLSKESDIADQKMSLRGDLLEGHGGDNEGLDDWLSSHRSRLNNRVLGVLTDISKGPTPVGFEDVLELAIGRFPYDEPLLRAWVSELTIRGRASLAATHVEEFRRRLRRDIGIELSVDTYSWATAAISTAPLRPGEKVETIVPHDHSGLPRLVLLPPKTDAQSAAAHAAKSLVSEVTLALCRLRTFAMFAPYTARQLTMEDAEEQANRLGADYFISTELLNRDRLGFRLVHLSTRLILASEVVDLSQFDAAGEELAKAIAAFVSQHIAKLEMSTYRRSGEASAYVHYLLGCERLQYDLAAVRKARKHFVRALDLSPHFVQAKAMLARTLNMEWLILSREETELLDQAESLARQALDVDPLAPSGHWEIGNTLLYRQRMDESLHHIRSARQRAPHLADILSDEADVLVHLGEAKLATAKIEAAIHLNPLPPDEYRWVQGSAEFIYGDYAAALRHMRMMKDQRPVARIMAASAAMIGDKTAANRYRRIWLERYPDFRIADWVKIIPVKKPEAVEQMVEALRRAGFS